VNVEEKKKTINELDKLHNKDDFYKDCWTILRYGDRVKVADPQIVMKRGESEEVYYHIKII